VNANLCSETNTSWAFCDQNAFVTGATPQTPLEELTLLPRSSSWKGEGLLPPLQEPHFCTFQPLASILYPFGLKPPVPTPISGYASIVLKRGYAKTGKKGRWGSAGQGKKLSKGSKGDQRLCHGIKW